MERKDNNKLREIESELDKYLEETKWERFFLIGIILLGVFIMLLTVDFFRDNFIFLVYPLILVVLIALFKVIYSHFKITFSSGIPFKIKFFYYISHTGFFAAIFLGYLILGIALYYVTGSNELFPDSLFNYIFRFKFSIAIFLIGWIYLALYYNPSVLKFVIENMNENNPYILEIPPLGVNIFEGYILKIKKGFNEVYVFANNLRMKLPPDVNPEEIKQKINENQKEIFYGYGFDVEVKNKWIIFNKNNFNYLSTGRYSSYIFNKTNLYKEVDRAIKVYELLIE